MKSCRSGEEGWPDASRFDGRLLTVLGMTMRRDRARVAGTEAARGRGWAEFAAVQVLVLPLTVAITAYGAFSVFRTYDDEGMLMLLVRHVLDGHRLYDDVLSAYGPVYYVYEVFLHGTLRLPLTHDVTRMMTIAHLTLTGVLSAAIVFALSRRLWLAALAHVLVVFELEFLVSEPGHPQELVVLLVALVVLLMALEDARSRLVLPAVGVIVAALVLVKVNVGALTAIGTSAALIAIVRPSRTVTALRATSTALVILLPWLLMWHDLDAGARTLAYLMSTAAACVALVSMLGPSGEHSVGDLIAVAGWGVVGLVGFVCAIVLRGTSVVALVYSLVVLPQRLLATGRYEALGLYPWTPIACAAAILLAIVSTLSGRQRLRAGAPAALVALARFAFAYLVVTSVLRFDPTFLMCGLDPFAWLVLLPVPGVEPEEEHHAARLALAWTAVLQPLQTYPIAGTHLFVGHFLLAVCGVLALGDGLAWVRAMVPGARHRLARALATTVALAVLAHVGYGQLAGARRRYAELTPLTFAGAERIHVDAGEQQALHTLVDALEENCDTFIAYPGFNSLYFWTGMRPATLDVLSSTVHMVELFPEERREAMIRALAAEPRGCVVLYPSLWPPNRAFLERIRRDFVVHSRPAGYTLLVRKDRGVGGAPG
jgi:hypothetical protein